MLAHDIIIRPIITEKSMQLAEDKKYTFVVAKTANKIWCRSRKSSHYELSLKNEKNVKKCGMNSIFQKSNREIERFK